jgi:hypothetical protein
MIFIVGDRVRYIGNARIRPTVQAGDLATVVRGNEDYETDVACDFDGLGVTPVLVSPDGLEWLG